MQQTKVIHKTMQEFYQLSGQKVNESKSKIWYTPNTSSTLIQQIQLCLGMPTTHDLDVYPGVPLMHERPQSHHFQKLIDKVRGRLSGWRFKLLSQATRLILIHSALSVT